MIFKKNSGWEKEKKFFKNKEEFLKKCRIYNYIKIVTDYIK